MKKSIAWSCGLLGASALMVGGCASYPISPALQQRAQPLTPAQVVGRPDAYKGALVIWGGVVANTENETNGGALYVLDFPLTPHGRPETDNYSPGRFIARSGGYLQAEVFRWGRPVTIAGTLAGVQTEEYQNRKFSYPVVDIDEMHIWHYGGYGAGWYWGYPYDAYYPGWDLGLYDPWWDFGLYGAWGGWGGWYGPGRYGHGYGPRGFAGRRGGFHGGGFHGGGGHGGGGHGR